MTNNSVRNPVTSDRYSATPPAIAPSRLAPKSSGTDFERLNAEPNSRPGAQDRAEHQHGIEHRLVRTALERHAPDGHDVVERPAEPATSRRRATDV